MNSDELLCESRMSYYELCNYLQNKYGIPQYNYFYTEECKARNKNNSRGSEGLECHHIREDMGNRLSSPSSAVNYPWEWQEKKHLVYCNLLEHLLLHIKIGITRQKGMIQSPLDIPLFFSPGGLFYICQQINDCFMKGDTRSIRSQKAFMPICNNYKDYILLLKASLAYLHKQFVANAPQESYILENGSSVSFGDSQAEIISLTEKKDQVVLRFPDGSEKEYLSRTFSRQLTFYDQLDFLRIAMSEGFETYYPSIYYDLSSENSELVNSISNSLSVDFIGYGFPQFSSLQLDRKKYGSSNVDQYLYKALPSFSNPSFSPPHTPPIFWDGMIPLEVKERGIDYIVRIKASFQIKRDEQPFIRYKENDYLRTPTKRVYSIDYNFLRDNGILLFTSAFLSRVDHKYHHYIKNLDGKTELATVILSLYRDDYELFLKRYNVYSLVFLDGCYFADSSADLLQLASPLNT